MERNACKLVCKCCMGFLYYCCFLWKRVKRTNDAFLYIAFLICSVCSIVIKQWDAMWSVNGWCYLQFFMLGMIAHQEQEKKKLIILPIIAILCVAIKPSYHTMTIFLSAIYSLALGWLSGKFQIDTTNILFICGGAFDGIEKIIESRQDTKSIGFGAEVSVKEDRNVGEILKDVMPEDFIKFGLIPEFIGRVPVVVTLDALDENALISILKEPKNSLTKQYHRLFELDGVELDFEDDALELVAKKSLERKTGARGLRAIMEGSLMDLMYKIPSDDTIRKCTITKDVVDGTGEPEIVRGEAPAQAKTAGSRRTSRTHKKDKPETA